MGSFLNKVSMFWFTTIVLVSCGVCFLFFIQSSSKLEILPLLIETKNHSKPLRNPGTFAEEHGPNASFTDLKYLDDSKFSFIYEKSKKQDEPFAGVWFPLENLNIDFSGYDVIEVNIKSLSLIHI